MDDFPINALPAASAVPTAPAAPAGSNTDDPAVHLKSAGFDPSKWAKLGKEDYEQVFNNPVVAPVLSGVLPAVRFDIGSKLPQVQDLIKKGPGAILAGGLSFYKSADAKTVVIFNDKKVNPDALKTADKEGKLPELVPPADELVADGGNTDENPAPEGMLTQGGMPKNAPSKVLSQINKNRLNSLMPKSPTDKPMPAAGVLNDLISRPV